MIWSTLSNLALVELCQQHGAIGKSLDVVASALSSFLNDNLIDCCDVSTNDCKQQVKLLEKQHQANFATPESLESLRKILSERRLKEIEDELQQVINEYHEVRDELESLSVNEDNETNDSIRADTTDDNEEINISGLIQELAASDESDFLDSSIVGPEPPLSQPTVASPKKDKPPVVDIKEEVKEEPNMVDDLPNPSTITSKPNLEEDEKAYKQWKRSILLLWKSISNHKWANVFMSPVTDDIAPGYSKVVQYPMDLTTLRRRIESGVIKSDLEFTRDVLVMFQNAFIYNNSDHEIYKLALEMQNDCLGMMQLHFGPSFFGNYEINVPETRQPRSRTIKNFEKF